MESRLVEPGRPLKILLAESETPRRDVTALSLQGAGYRVDRCASGEEAIDLTYSLRPNLLMLDLPTTPRDGLDVCRRLREDRAVPAVSRVPILMIGTPDDVDAIVALELGADDYLGRPFAARLLLARVKALLRECR